jgi:hypothetical protein
MGTARGLARVRREALAACMTCPLCRGLIREATAITLCLHTCKFPLLSLTLPPWLSLSRSFVRALYLRLSLPAPAPEAGMVSPPASPPRGRSSPRVCVLRFRVGFFLFSRSDAPGDRAGIRCEFFDPRRVVNALPFAWIVVVAFVARGHPCRGGHLARAAFAFASPWPALLLETRSSAGVGVSCPAPPGPGDGSSHVAVHLVFSQLVLDDPEVSRSAS